MSPLAWRILALLVKHAEHLYKDQYGKSYIAAWTLEEQLGGDTSTIDAAYVKIHPRNEYEQALHELIERGLVREKPDLPERFELVVKETSQLLTLNLDGNTTITWQGSVPHGTSISLRDIEQQERSSKSEPEEEK